MSSINLKASLTWYSSRTFPVSSQWTNYDWHLNKHKSNVVIIHNYTFNTGKNSSLLKVMSERCKYNKRRTISLCFTINTMMNHPNRVRDWLPFLSQWLSQFYPEALPPLSLTRGTVQSKSARSYCNLAKRPSNILRNSLMFLKRSGQCEADFNTENNCMWYFKVSEVANHEYSNQNSCGKNAIFQILH